MHPAFNITPPYGNAFPCFFSPGVIVTELQKRGGLNEEAYAAVSVCVFQS